MSDREYPCFTISQIAEIPEEDFPDFLAELPELIRHVRQIKASADDLAPQLKAAAPWPWKFLPLRLFAAMVRGGVHRATFVNDKGGKITLKAKLSEKHPEFYSRTENLRA